MHDLQRRLATVVATGTIALGATILAAPPASATPAPIIDLTVPRLAPDGPPIRVRAYIEPVAPDGPPIRVLVGDDGTRPAD